MTKQAAQVEWGFALGILHSGRTRLLSEYSAILNMVFLPQMKIGSFQHLAHNEEVRCQHVL